MSLVVSPKTIFHPLSILTVASLATLLSLLIPDGLYLLLVGERSYVFLNWTVYGFVALCLVMFALGIFAVNSIQRRVTPNPIDRLNLNLLRRVSLYLCVFVIGINLYAIYQLVLSYGSLGDLVNAILGIGVGDIRLNVYSALKDANAGWSIAFTANAVCVVYAVVLVSKDRGLFFWLAALVLIHLFLIAITQNKGPIASLVLGLILTRQLSKSAIVFNVQLVLKYVGLFVVGLVLFDILNSRRGGADDASFVGQLFGYFLASYNRLALLMDGKLEIPNMFMGFWTNKWYWGLPFQDVPYAVLKSLQFDIPRDAFDVWLETFASVGSSGLNPKYIWVTTFGEAYADYGYWGCLWFFLTGVLTQWVYLDLIQGRLRAYALYPFIVLSNLSWYSVANLGTRGILYALMVYFLYSMAGFFYRHRSSQRLSLRPQEDPA